MKGYCFSNNQTLHTFPNRAMALTEAKRQANASKHVITIWSYRSGKVALTVKPTGQQ